MKHPMPDEKSAYEAIRKSKEKFGQFHKVCFHVHTPESHDYRMLKNWSESDYQNASIKTLYDLCVERSVIPDSKMASLDSFVLEGDLECFNDKKELFSFLLLADAIIVKGIELILIADHHTIKGYSKLKAAIKVLHNLKTNRMYPEVLLGIEISCADKLHVVGIFDDQDVQAQDKIGKWLNENLLSVKEGSYQTSIDVLSFIRSIGGIGYIAHIDTSDIFKEKYLSGAYKKKLFSDELLQIIGISDYSRLNYISNNIKKHRNSEIKIILDNDAHDIDSISKNMFWIKGSKRDFSMIKEAIIDYDISISFESEETPKQYIKGVYIEPRKEGFLCGKDNQAFCLTFSRALNCIIGGRGTGKSTVLEVLEYILSQKCGSENKLDFLCSHGNAWLLYEYQDEEYLLEMRMPHKSNKDDSILRFFGRNRSSRYWYRYYFEQLQAQDYAYNHYFKISKVIFKEDEWFLETVKDKNKMQMNFFDTRYSVNELVNTASGDEISQFLYNILFENDVLARPEDVIRAKKKSGLIKELNSAQNALQKRRLEVESVINPFNDSQKGILRIVYTQEKLYAAPPLDQWLFGEKFNKQGWYNNYNITKENVIEYLLLLYDKLGIYQFLEIAVNYEMDKALEIINILDFCVDMNQDMVEQEIVSLSILNVSNVLKEIFDKLVSDKNMGRVTDYLKQYVAGIEKFSLEFNVNNKEGIKKAPLYKSVGTLSLGQKVVAMLSFILGYSDFSEDYRPLIIDQPEDNLDNQYIYKNLVNQLRKAKMKRQVIIATHNATIVTNAKADQVCVMCSDNQHGWIEVTGYPGEKRIKKYIIDYLEGGRESFMHKISIYEEALE